MRCRIRVCRNFHLLNKICISKITPSFFQFAANQSDFAFRLPQFFFQLIDCLLCIRLEKTREQFQNDQAPQRFHRRSSHPINPQHLGQLRQPQGVRGANELHRPQKRNQRQQDDCNIKPVFLAVCNLLICNRYHHNEFNGKGEPDHPRPHMQKAPQHQ